MRLLRRHDGLEGKGVGIIGEQDLVDHLGFVPGDMLVSLEHITPDCHLDLLLHGVGQRNGTLPNGLAHDDRHFVRLEGQPRGVKPDGRRLGLVQQTAVAPGVRRPNGSSRRCHCRLRSSRHCRRSGQEPDEKAPVQPGGAEPWEWLPLPPPWSWR